MRKNNKILKIVCIILIFLFIILSINYAFADGNKYDSVKTGMANANKMSGGTELREALNVIIGIMQYAGMGIALIVITMLGIKYILAAPSDKADVKRQILPIFIGCVLVIGGVNIAGAIYNLVTTSLPNTDS